MKAIRELFEEAFGLFFIVALVLIGWGFTHFGCNKLHEQEIDIDNPRNKHGTDTVEYNDSIYVIHFKIDSVYENPNPTTVDNDRPGDY